VLAGITRARVLALAGEAGVVASDGRIQNGLVNLLAADLLTEVLGAAGGNDGTTPLQCLLADLQVENGVANAKALFLSTNKIVLTGRGDVKLGPTSLGGLALIMVYVAGMRAVYKAGRTDMHVDDIPAPTGSARNAWIGFGISVAVVIVAGRFLASSADTIAELSGISASFIGVLLVAIVTTLPEGSVTVAAALRKSYGIVIGNVYGSNAFNVSIFFFSDMFRSEGPLLGTMEAAHFAAGAAALILMTMGYLVIRSCQSETLRWPRALTPVIPIVYLGALYLVFTLGQK